MRPSQPRNYGYMVLRNTSSHKQRRNFPDSASVKCQLAHNEIKHRRAYNSLTCIPRLLSISRWRGLHGRGTCGRPYSASVRFLLCLTNFINVELTYSAPTLSLPLATFLSIPLYNSTHRHVSLSVQTLKRSMQNPRLDEKALIGH